MKNVLNPSIRLTAMFAVMASFLTGCHDKAPTEPAQAAPASAPAPAAPQMSAAEQERIARANLLDSISGVWKPTSGSGLTVISASGNDIQIVQGDTLLPVALGDVDADNATVNFKIFWKSGKQEVRTISQTNDRDGDGNSVLPITITAADGSQKQYTFVRKISADDLNRISAMSAQGAQAAAQAPASAPAAPPANMTADRGVIDMWLGGIDMNMRSCPGSTCAPVIIVPKDSSIRVDTATIRGVTESSGVETPWVRVTYEGTYCTTTDQNTTTNCTPSQRTDAPVSGWMNYTRLLPSPRASQ
jgi:hypothetical protein